MPTDVSCKAFIPMVASSMYNQQMSPKTMSHKVITVQLLDTSARNKDILLFCCEAFLTRMNM